MSQLSGAERRRFGRRKCHVRGWILAPRAGRIACIMTDYSEGGARLELPAPISLPARFDLGLDGLTTVIACELRHSTPRSVGVEFVKQNNRRSLTSALATEKMLQWLDDKHRSEPPTVPTDPTPAAPRPAGRHPLRAALLARSRADDDDYAEEATASTAAHPGATGAETRPSDTPASAASGSPVAAVEAAARLDSVEATPAHPEPGLRYHALAEAPPPAATTLTLTLLQAAT